jgi:hypothetical protein
MEFLAHLFLAHLDERLKADVVRAHERRRLSRGGDRQEHRDASRSQAPQGAHPAAGSEGHAHTDPTLVA